MNIGLSISSVQNARSISLFAAGRIKVSESIASHVRNDVYTYKHTHTYTTTCKEAIVCMCMRNGACLAIEVGGRVVVPSGVLDFRCAAAAAAAAATGAAFYTCPRLTSVARRVARGQNMDLNVKSEKPPLRTS